MSAPDELVPDAAALDALGFEPEALRDPATLRALLAVLRSIGYAVLEPWQLDRLDERIRAAAVAGDDSAKVSAWCRVHGGLQAFIADQTAGRGEFAATTPAAPG